MLIQLFAEITRQIVECDFAKLELLIYNAGSDAVIIAPLPEGRSKLRKIYDTFALPHLRERLLYSLYERWDRSNTDDAIDPVHEVDCSALLAGVERLDVVPITKKWVHRFPPEAIAKIRSKELDVLLRFGFNILRGDILSCAKYGMWSYHHGDNDYYRGGQAYFWEVYEQNPISGVILQVLTEELDAGHVLAKGFFATAPGISQVKNRVSPFWGSSTFLIQKLRELHGRGWESVEKKCLPRAPYLGKKKIYRAPTNGEMAGWLLPTLVKKTLARFGRTDTVAFWRLALRTGAKPLEDSQNSDGFMWLHCPKGHFYADPFFFDDNGKLWLFFEDYYYGEQRGKLACAEFKDGKLVGEVIPVLDKPYHLSYPCVFRDGDAIHMIPESKANSTVDLYHAVDFPRTWEHIRVLYDGPAVDTTVHHKDGVWYFFTTLKETRGDGLQLWLFTSDSPAGEWREHPASPISTDVRSSRGAGAIFERNGRLFRPSQDCGVAYGRSFTLNEILVLNRDEYLEKPCVTVDPVWAPGLAGTHSYAQSGAYEVIDGCEFVPPSQVRL